MTTINSKINFEFQRFREWEKYNNQNEIYYEYDEYPHWIDIYTAIKKIPNDFKLSLDSIKMILYFLARDHESEITLETLQEKPALGHLIAKEGVNCIDRDARWQVAVLLGYFKDSKLLVKMIENDEEEYVRRRGLLALRDIDKISSEKIAIKHLHSIYEYERVVAIDTLNFLSSSYFEKALNTLKNDSSIIVQNRIERILSSSHI